MYHIFFIHSSVDGHLGCFHVLAIVNSVNIVNIVNDEGLPSSSGSLSDGQGATWSSQTMWTSLCF